MAYVPWTQELDKLKIHFPFESAAIFFHFRSNFFFRVIEVLLNLPYLFILFYFLSKIFSII